MSYNLEVIFNNQQLYVEKLLSTHDPHELYDRIISLGKRLPLLAQPPLPTERVHGCQSNTYIRAVLEQDLIYFFAQSDALISAGLAAILLQIYHAQPIQLIVHYPPSFLKQHALVKILSPLRAQGFNSIYQKMKQEALILLQH